MIYTEITPNPASLKFVTGVTFLKKGTADFPSIDTVEDAPLVKKMFDFRFTEAILVGKNFITLTKGNDFTWEEVIPVVKEFLKSYLASGQPVLTGKYLEIEADAPINESELEQRIRQIIDESVRPAVERDGGDIIYQGFDEGVVKLKMQGSCAGCPSSMVTLKAGIEGLLTRMIPEVKSVIAI